MSLSTSDRVLLMGDSLSVGLTKPMQALADKAGIAFKGHGVVGSRIDEWDKHYFAETVGDFAPTVVVVSLGTNDMKMFDPKTQQAGHVQSLLDKVRGAGARVVWIIPPTMPFDDKGVRQMIEDAHPDLAIHGELLELPRGDDKIHMTPSGYKTFAQAVWDCLTLDQCPGGGVGLPTPGGGGGGDGGGGLVWTPDSPAGQAGLVALVGGLGLMGWRLYSGHWPWPGRFPF